MKVQSKDVMLRIFDAHVHLYDTEVNQHTFLEEEEFTFRAIVGDYSTLPGRYLTADYLQDSNSFQVEGMVWYEFLSADPIQEAKWAQNLAHASPIPQSLVPLVNFLAPNLEEQLETYGALPNVVAVREHLAWDHDNSLRHLAAGPEILTDTNWRQAVGKLQHYGLKCVLEVFATQLADLYHLIRLYPEISFLISLMGWPLDLSPEGYLQWRQDMETLSFCKNVSVEIAGLELIFGRSWRSQQVSPWLLSLIDLFGPSRCLFGSQMPITNLSMSFEELYNAYQQLLLGFSDTEQDQMFRSTAASWFKRH